MNRIFGPCVVKQASTFDEAVKLFSTGDLIDEIYYIVGGAAPGEGEQRARAAAVTQGSHKQGPSPNVKCRMSSFIYRTYYEYHVHG